MPFLAARESLHVPDADFPQSLHLCPLVGQCGIVLLSPSFSEFDPERKSRHDNWSRFIAH
jgi:hypothetical protein